MRYTVRMRGVTVGYSELEETDAPLGRAWGSFRPGLGYELVQPVFKLFSEAVPMRGGEPLDQEKLARYHAARDQLGLTLVSANEREIATSVIHIADYPGTLELDVLISDEQFWAVR